MNKKKFSIILALILAFIFCISAYADLLPAEDDFMQGEAQTVEVVASVETTPYSEEETMVLFAADDISADVTEEETAILFGAIDDEAEIAFGDAYDDDADYSAKDSGFFSNIGVKILISLIIGLVVAGIYVSILKGQLKSVKMNSGASNYMVKDSLKLSVNSDVYLYKETSSTPKPKTNTKEN